MSMSIMCMCVRKGKKVFLDRCNNIIGKNYVSNTYYLVDALHWECTHPISRCKICTVGSSSLRIVCKLNASDINFHLCYWFYYLSKPNAPSSIWSEHFLVAFWKFQEKKLQKTLARNKIRCQFVWVCVSFCKVKKKLASKSVWSSGEIYYVTVSGLEWICHAMPCHDMQM